VSGERVNPVVFREYDIRGVAGVDLTEETVGLVARALGTRVRDAGGTRVVLGRDVRLSSPGFHREAVAGLLATGCEVIDVGIVATPLVYFAAQQLEVDGLCMITGSHNPANYNGMKIGVGQTTIYGEAIQEILRMVRKGDFARGQGKVTTHDIVTPYQDYVAQNLKLGRRKLKVVIDAGNGTGGVAVPIFERLGVEVVPLFLEPDGRFPNHHPDPTVEENLEALKRKVLETGADVGIAYDGDSDRVGAVDEQGHVLWGDQLMILFARAILAEVPGAAVVAEVKCSFTLYDDIKKHGGRGIMWKAGHSLIKAKMKEEHAELAGEMSGHIFFGHRWLGFDDGIYSSARLVELLSQTDRPMSSLLADVPKTYSTPELRVDCREEIKFEVVRQAQAFFTQGYEAITVDGVRVVFPDGWGLVRASNTQPILVLRFEATTAARLGEIRKLVEDRVNAIIAGLGGP
jgi:phosphomannomutase/phosphoglucomutase